MFIVGYGFRPFMLIHTGCTLVSLLPVIFSGGDVQRNGYSCLPLRPPQMSLGLPFNQCRLYPYMNFGLAAQSCMTTCQLAALRSCYCPLWVSPSRLAVDHRHETHACRLLSGIYPAPYGRTNEVVEVMIESVVVNNEDITTALNTAQDNAEAALEKFLSQ